MEKEYYYIVKLEFGGSIPANNKKEAIEFIKERFSEDNNIDLNNKEIEITDIVKERERFCVKCGKTSGLIDEEDICYSCAKMRGRI